MVYIKYFGAVAEVTNCTSECIKTGSSSLAEIIEEIYSKYDLENVPVKLALNQDILEKVEGINIKEKDEIAVLPPFAGG